MAEPTATAEPADSAGQSIEADLDELDALLAEVNANDKPSAGGSEERMSSEAEAETTTAAEADTHAAPTEEVQSAETVIEETCPAEAGAGSSQELTGEWNREDAAETPAGEDHAPACKDQDDAEAEQEATETAELETQATDESDASGASEAEPVDAVPDADGSPEPGPLKPTLAHAAWVLLWPLVAGLIILDKPFANVSLQVKNILGCVAIATTMTAVATWVLAGFIVRLQ